MGDFRGVLLCPCLYSYLRPLIISLSLQTNNRAKLSKHQFNSIVFITLFLWRHEKRWKQWMKCKRMSYRMDVYLLQALTMTIYRLSNFCYFRLTTKCDFAKCRFSSQGVQYSSTYHGISEFAVKRSTAKSFFT